jgi:gliding motility-associated-like protein
LLNATKVKLFGNAKRNSKYQDNRTKHCRLKSKISILSFVGLLCLTTLKAQVWMVENKGQWDSKVQYMGEFGHGAFFVQQNGFKILMHNEADLEEMGGHKHGSESNTKAAVSNTILHSHAYEVKFLGSNPAAQRVADKPLSHTSNYFIGNDSSKWASNCRLFQAVTYKDLYPGIDIRYYTEKGYLKYDLIVHPGANPNRIALQYDGLDDIEVKNKELVLKTSVGSFKELYPYTYQYTNKGKEEIQCRYKLSGNLINFDLEDYDKTQTLVIDPSLIFCSFTGSTADNWGFTATYGPGGTAFAAGIVFNSGYPTSNGAFQTNWAGGGNDDGIGGYDIGIIKLSPDGSNRIYATYLGGNGNEQPHSLVTDANGSLYIAGRSNSSNYPTTAATVGTGGDYDIIISVLNVAGNGLIGSRKIGGSRQDGVNIQRNYSGTQGANSLRRNYGDDARSEVILDGSGLWIASATQSNNFPTVNAFQTTFGGGLQDGVVVRLTPNLNTVLMSSFYGGNGEDACYVLAPYGGIMSVGGGTNSTNLQGNFAGALSATNRGEIDGFVVQINTASNTLGRATYVGTTGIDQVYGIQYDDKGFPYVMGTTTSTWTAQNAAFSQASGKQFYGKLRPDLSGWVYTSMFGVGTSPNISPIAFLVDKCENVYISGWGGKTNGSTGYPNSGTSGLPITPDALKSSSPDASDFYFIVIKRNSESVLYGSYFGEDNGRSNVGDHVDGGTSRFDKSGVIYQAVCANCGRTGPFPTTPGAWSEFNNANGGGRCNEAIIKIAFNLGGVISGPRSSIRGRLRDTSGCVPMTVEFVDTIGEARRYIWDFGDGSPRVSGPLSAVTHTYNIVGIYQVMLIAEDSTTCNVRDTAYLRIRVRNDEATANFTRRKIGPCTSTTYEFTNLSVPSPGKSFNNQSFTWLFDDGSLPELRGTAPFQHTFPGAGTFRVKMVLTDTNFCNAPDTITSVLRIAPNVRARFETPPVGCVPYRAQFNNTSIAGEEFIWDFGDGGTSNLDSPEHLYNDTGTYVVTLIANDTSTCNRSDTFRFSIQVKPKPKAGFTFAPVPPLENEPILFTNTSTGAIRYRWDFGDGDSLVTTSLTPPVSHSYNASRTYKACLTAINQFGCTDSVCQPVRALVTPLLDVPTGFTPNGDGVNDYIQVLGFGIDKMNFRVYNRWGKQVFNGTSRKDVWDGTYNGVLQPMESYSYFLEVQFTDGTKASKRGNITLIR